jgi:hypothetical protein
MGRTLLLAVLLALTATASSADAQEPQPQPPRPLLSATLESCAASPLPVDRLASFVASMPAYARATRMRIRYDLERRRPGERYWRRVRAAGFGVWERSAANVAGFVFRRRVNGLPVPASYRALVRFRWIADDGSAVRRAHARTAACEQPDLRPNLVPGALTAILAVQPGLAIYTLVVANTGRSTASPFSVSVGSAKAEVAPLSPGEQRTVPVLTLACAARSRIVVRVDADRRVEESDERANAARRPCPLLLG